MTETLEPRSDAWLIEQARTFGGSTAAVALNQHRWITRPQLWERMRAAHQGQVSALQRPLSDDMRRGLVFEAKALELLAERLGTEIRPHNQSKFIYNPDFPWAHALPDGWTNNGIAEVKVPRPGTIARCNISGLLPEWKIQGWHNMAICGTHIYEVGLLDPISALIHDFVVAWDQEAIDELMEAERLFHESVLANEPPDDGPPIVADDQKVPDLQLDEPDDTQHFQTYLRLQGIKDDVEEALGLTREQIQSRMGKAESALCPDARALATWKWRKGSILLNKVAVAIRHPAVQRDDACWMTGQPSRVFKVQELKEN